MRLADVYVGYPVDDLYTYKVPDGIDVLPGVRVKVNFNNRVITAFVSQVYLKKDESRELKFIISVIDETPIFDQRLIELSQYIASNYLCTVGEAISMALPSGEKFINRYKNPFQKMETRDFQFTAEQKLIFENVIESQKNNRLLHLIHGITGSGKTAVYIEIAKHIIKQERSVLYLVPEIPLTSQVYERLYNVFGKDLVIYHSKQTSNQRLYSWKQFYNGNAKIGIGTRSAVFLQCPNLGLIIIDEEHDTSFKEQSTPRYNARRIAFYRSKMENSLVVMGSATPSIESLYMAQKGLLMLHVLNKRYGGAMLPEIEIIKIDLKKPEDMLSPRLKLFSKRAIDHGNQVIYLLNKRGFSPIVLCYSCKVVLTCPNCNISLNYHKGDIIHCHYCGYRRKFPEKCTNCDSNDFIKVGAGTQRIEDIIKSTFKVARVFRLDQDSSRRKNMIFDLIDKMNMGEIDILLGTQMIAKGFDFQNVSIVGVVLADIGLHLPDFRATERIFSLLIQIAGRCGRGRIPGKVIIQTLDNSHPIFNFLKNHDYLSFYRYELSIRRMLDYPPFSRIARLLVRGSREDKVIESIKKIKDFISEKINQMKDSITILGPSQAPLSKIGSNYRYHFIFKSKDMNVVKRIIKHAKSCVLSKGVYLEIDIDPYDMM